MKEYTVRWEIEVSARSKREAAQRAREIQQNKENQATCYDVAVFEEEGNHPQFTLIDLEPKT